MSARPTAARPAILVVAAGCLLGAGFLLGRLLPGGDASPPGYLQQLTDALDLRPDQVATLEHVLSEEDRDIDALLKRITGPLQAETAARRVRTEQQVLAVLDPAQRQRYDSLMAAEGDR
jgi:hypothetical protein